MTLNQLQEIERYVFHLFKHDVTGHDYYHLKRVVILAKKIANIEKADTFICEAAAWLHDIGDEKLFQNPKKMNEEMNGKLLSIGLSTEKIHQINQIISDISFRKGNIPQTLEGKIVQDADRIDAIGAIGIARTFAYGGANGQFIYHHDDKENTSIKHFYDKLLTLKEKLNTNSAKQIAEERHDFLLKFLNQFFKEWSLDSKNTR